MKLRFNEQMEAYRILIWNAADETTLSTRLALYSYNEEKFNEGKALWNDTDALNKQQANEYDEKVAATDALNSAREVVEKKLYKLKKLARLVFEDDKRAYDLMNLKALNITRFEDFITDAERVYQNLLANTAMIDTLSQFGFSVESITQLQTEVQELVALQQNQVKESGEAQQATKDKWSKFEELKAYCQRLIEIARIEFEDDAQHLEKLGILVRS